VHISLHIFHGIECPKYNKHRNKKKFEKIFETEAGTSVLESGFMVAFPKKIYKRWGSSA